MPKVLKSDKRPPVHPGEILKETLEELGISMNRLAQEICVPANRISAIVAGQRSITGETALRLAAAHFAEMRIAVSGLQNTEFDGQVTAILRVYA